MHPVSDRQGRAGAAGFSLLEVLISAGILATMVYAIGSLTVSGTDAQEFARRLNRVTEITQDLVDDIRLELVSSVRLFGDNAEGNGNLGVFDFDGAPPLLPGTRLPTIDANGTIQRDSSGDEITGNALFFTKLAWSDRYRCASGAEYLIDVYRWVAWYLTVEGDGPQAGSAVGLNLVRMVSEPLADAGAVDRITDPDDQAEVLLHLLNGTADVNGIVHEPLEVVWNRGAMPNVVGTFRQIDPASGVLRDNPIVLTGRSDPWEVERGTDEVTGLLTYRHHSIGTNFARPTFGVARFGRVEAPGAGTAGFPHGFETQVVGPSSARQALVHMVVVSTNRRGQVAWSDLQAVVDCRDL